MNIIEQGERDYYTDTPCPYDQATQKESYDLWWVGWNNSDDEVSESFKNDPLAR